MRRPPELVTPRKLTYSIKDGRIVAKAGDIKSGGEALGHWDSLKSTKAEAARQLASKDSDRVKDSSSGLRATLAGLLGKERTTK